MGARLTRPGRRRGGDGGRRLLARGNAPALLLLLLLCLLCLCPPARSIRIGDLLLLASAFGLEIGLPPRSVIPLLTLGLDGLLTLRDLVRPRPHLGAHARMQPELVSAVGPAHDHQDRRNQEGGMPRRAARGALGAGPRGAGGWGACAPPSHASDHCPALAFEQD